MQVTPGGWETQREQLKQRVLEILGPFPAQVPDLAPRVVEETQCEGYLRRKVLYRSEPGEDIPAYLMIPDGLEAPRPAVLCIHPTTGGSGKDRIAGVWGISPGTPPDASRSYAHQLAQRGYVVLAPDFLTDGERVFPGWKPYHTRPFYEANPEWSAVGKSIWDAMRAVDFLETVPEADCTRIATLGHSFGGHHAFWIAAFEERIKCVASNGSYLTWRTQERLGWARPLDSWYTYINKMRPYLEAEEDNFPVAFHEFMGLVAPRPMLAMLSDADAQSEEELEVTCDGLKAAWGALDAADRLVVYRYPGEHDFPLPVREMAYAWLHRHLRFPGREL